MVEFGMTRMQAVLQQEDVYCGMLVRKIAALQPTLVLCSQGIARPVLEELAMQGVVAVPFVKRGVLVRVSRATGAAVVPSVNHLDKLPRAAVIGRARRFRVEPISLLPPGTSFPEAEVQVGGGLGRVAGLHPGESASAATRAVVERARAMRAATASLMRVDANPGQQGCTVILRGGPAALKSAKAALRAILPVVYTTVCEASCLVDMGLAHPAIARAILADHYGRRPQGQATFAAAGVPGPGIASNGTDPEAKPSSAGLAPAGGGPRDEFRLDSVGDAPGRSAAPSPAPIAAGPAALPILSSAAAARLEAAIGLVLPFVLFSPRMEAAATASAAASGLPEDLARVAALRAAMPQRAEALMRVARTSLPELGPRLHNELGLGRRAAAAAAVSIASARRVLQQQAAAGNPVSGAVATAASAAISIALRAAEEARNPSLPQAAAFLTEASAAACAGSIVLAATAGPAAAPPMTVVPLPHFLMGDSASPDTAGWRRPLRLALRCVHAATLAPFAASRDKASEDLLFRLADSAPVVPRAVSAALSFSRPGAWLLADSRRRRRCEQQVESSAHRAGHGSRTGGDLQPASEAKAGASAASVPAPSQQRQGGAARLRSLAPPLTSQDVSEALEAVGAGLAGFERQAEAAAASAPPPWATSDIFSELSRPELGADVPGVGLDEPLEVLAMAETVTVSKSPYHRDNHGKSHPVLGCSPVWRICRAGAPGDTTLSEFLHSVAGSATIDVPVLDQDEDDDSGFPGPVALFGLADAGTAVVKRVNTLATTRTWWLGTGRIEARVVRLGRAVNVADHAPPTEPLPAVMRSPALPERLRTGASASSGGSVAASPRLLPDGGGYAASAGKAASGASSGAGKASVVPPSPMLRPGAQPRSGSNSPRGRGGAAPGAGASAGQHSRAELMRRPTLRILPMSEVSDTEVLCFGTCPKQNLRSPACLLSRGAGQLSLTRFVEMFLCNRSVAAYQPAVTGHLLPAASQVRRMFVLGAHAVEFRYVPVPVLEVATRRILPRAESWAAKERDSRLAALLSEASRVHSGQMERHERCCFALGVDQASIASSSRAHASRTADAGEGAPSTPAGPGVGPAGRGSPFGAQNLPGARFTTPDEIRVTAIELAVEVATASKAARDFAVARATAITAAAEAGAALPRLWSGCDEDASCDALAASTAAWRWATRAHAAEESLARLELVVDKVFGTGVPVVGAVVNLGPPASIKQALEQSGAGKLAPAPASAAATLPLSPQLQMQLKQQQQQQQQQQLQQQLQTDRALVKGVRFSVEVPPPAASRVRLPGAAKAEAAATASALTEAAARQQGGGEGADAAGRTAGAALAAATEAGTLDQPEPVRVFSETLGHSAESGVAVKSGPAAMADERGAARHLSQAADGLIMARTSARRALHSSGARSRSSGAAGPSRSAPRELATAQPASPVVRGRKGGAFGGALGRIALLRSGQWRGSEELAEEEATPADLVSKSRLAAKRASEGAEAAAVQSHKESATARGSTAAKLSASASQGSGTSDKKGRSGGQPSRYELRRVSTRQTLSSLRGRLRAATSSTGGAKLSPTASGADDGAAKYPGGGHTSRSTGDGLARELSVLSSSALTDGSMQPSGSLLEEAPTAKGSGDVGAERPLGPERSGEQRGALAAASAASHTQTSDTPPPAGGCLPPLPEAAREGSEDAGAVFEPTHPLWSRGCFGRTLALTPEEILLSSVGQDVVVASEGQGRDGSVKLRVSCLWATHFHALRQLCLGSQRSFVESLAISSAWRTSGGKSGSTFERSQDHRFVVKAVSRNEFTGFTRNALAYFDHMREALCGSIVDPDMRHLDGSAAAPRLVRSRRPSFLVRILGAFEVNVSFTPPTPQGAAARFSRARGPTTKSFTRNVLVMENLWYGTTVPRGLKFDLKGKARNIQASDEAREAINRARHAESERAHAAAQAEHGPQAAGLAADRSPGVGPTAGPDAAGTGAGASPDKAEKSTVLLDSDFLMLTEGQPLALTETSMAVLMDGLRGDTEFLCDCRAMDYSLLVGVNSSAGRIVVGIIDYANTFTTTKFIEHAFKSIIESDATVQAPARYRSRMLRAVRAYFMPVPTRLAGPAIALGLRSPTPVDSLGSLWEAEHAAIDSDADAHGWRLASAPARSLAEPVLGVSQS
ncbi:hypothetical protein FNF31_00409 [Cafeteria roenbergensis]|uniref:1-phosphatidylinositol-3-phosphate 5-kinase n=1 Tax=Cafeteria roenbergensis TaxID=33653 RepID=A0A5A8DTN5_CAFRO|nr:hypothetical protein FNF31_00409 [Cafeteria roenbergensis]